MLNKIIIYGRLVRDPELRFTQSQTPVATFTVAVDRDFQSGGTEDKTDFIECAAWRKTGEFVSKNFRKGSLIVVSGRLQSRKWEDRDGNKRVAWEINAESVYFGGSKKDNDSYQAQQAQNVSAAEFEELGDSDSDEGLPF